MSMREKLPTFCAILLILALHIPAFAAEKKPVPPGPIPAEILSAKRVFIANAGWDEPYFTNTLIKGGPTRAYDQFYAAIKSSGRYELVTGPADADLLFQIQFNIYTPPAVRTGTAGPVIGPAPYDASFRLEIRDPKTNALLWAFVEHVDQALLQGNRDKDFDQALSRLIGDVAMLGTPQPTDAAAGARP
jgi:hypothetical protein